MNKLRHYQEQAVLNVSRKLASGAKNVIFQLATGGGKTVVLSTISDRYIKKSNQKVLILVHREELLSQTCKALMNWYGIMAHEVTADTKRIKDAEVYVGMCETVFRRMIKNPNYLPEIGLLIIDETHLGNYFKLHDIFPKSYIIGFTATPLSANKFKPLKNFFEDIVCGVDVPELIKEKSLVQNKTYSVKGAVDRNSLAVRRGEFDEDQMSREFSKSKNVQNTIVAYEQKAMGKKTIIFNCNIAHSKVVTEAFIDAGYNAKHLDGQSDDRKLLFKWLKETPGAILCNVGVATTGFDEPSLECVIMNRATMSMPLWLQCTGRGARPFENKQEFIIIDLGGNAVTHGDWSDERDWHKIFHHPPKKSDKKGVSPVKDCPKCEALLAVTSMTCRFCGFEFPKKEEVYDREVIELILFKQPVSDLIEMNSDKKDYFTLFQIGNNIATQAKYKIRNITETEILSLNVLYQEKVKEWCEIKGKKYNRFHKELTYNHLVKSLS